MYRNPIELFTVSVGVMFVTFYQANYMDPELMDHIIKYWKMDQQMNIVYRSGERVLLSPLFITVFFFFSLSFVCSFYQRRGTAFFLCIIQDVGVFVRSELHCHFIIKDFLVE